MASGLKRASIRAMRSVARLDRMRSRTRPPVSVSMRGAINSAMVLTALAPIASRTSTCRWTTNIVPSSVGMRWQVRRFRPPPSLIMVEGRSLHMRISSSSAPITAASAASKSTTSSTWTCAIMMGGSLLLTKPPVDLHLRAMLEAAATTLDSSKTKGMRYSSPSTMKFVAKPTGRTKRPTTFSIMWSAASSERASAEAKASTASSLRLVASLRA